MGAALQCGAIEDKARGRFAEAIQMWLNDERINLKVLPEYRPPAENGESALKVDFALFDPNSVNQACLDIRALIELKSNYATQRRRGSRTPRRLAHGEFGKRIPSAVGQAAAYRSITGSDHAYVLYLVCDPTTRTIPEGPTRDNGWVHWRRLHDRPAQNIERVEKTIQIVTRRHGIKILGESRRTDTTGEPIGFYCCLLDAPDPDKLNTPTLDSAESPPRPFEQAKIRQFLEIGGKGMSIADRQQVRKLCEEHHFSELAYHFWYTKFRKMERPQKDDR